MNQKDNLEEVGKKIVPPAMDSKPNVAKQNFLVPENNKITELQQHSSAPVIALASTELPSDLIASSVKPPDSLKLSLAPTISLGQFPESGISLEHQNQIKVKERAVYMKY
jgi:hypothetical protein